MNRTKKRFSTILMAAGIITTGLFISQGIVEASNEYKDIKKNHWAYETIKEATALGYFKGDGNGYFHPEREVTRAEFAAILARMFEEEARVQVPFVDVDNLHWGKDAIEELLAIGIINANDYANKRFEPTKVMTRNELSKWLTNALSVKQPTYTTIMTTIRDSEHTLLPTTEYLRGGIAKADQGYIGVMLGTGLFSGYIDGSFKPTGNTSRSEVATLAIRFKNMQDKAPTEFKGLNELVEVSETATNMTSISPFIYRLHPNNLKFDSVIKENITYGTLGEMKLHKAIFIPYSSYNDAITSIYGKMFVDSNDRFFNNTYQIFVNKTFKANKDLNVDFLSFLNAHTNVFLNSVSIQNGVSQLYGYKTLPSTTKLTFKANSDFNYWTSFSQKIGNRGNGITINSNSEFTYYMK